MVAAIVAAMVAALVAALVAIGEFGGLDRRNRGATRRV